LPQLVRWSARPCPEPKTWECRAPDHAPIKATPIGAALTAASRAHAYSGLRLLEVHAHDSPVANGYRLAPVAPTPWIRGSPLRAASGGGRVYSNQVPKRPKRALSPFDGTLKENDPAEAG
jgi:hypothetical protein